MVAQTPPPALAVSVSPKQAGTEAKPRSVKLTLTVAPLAGVPSLTVFFPKQLHIAFGEHGHVRFGENFQQRNFKRRERYGTIKSITALLPLPRHAWMPE